MIHKNLFIHTAVFIMSIILCASVFAAKTKSISWQTYETGMKMIENEKKKGFLHFYTDWCTFCKIMNKQTFTDAKIINYLNDNFISIRVNAEKQKNIAYKYGANRFPLTWFLSEDSSSLSNQPGFIPPDKLLEILKFLHTDSFKSMKFSEYIQKTDKQKDGTVSKETAIQKAGAETKAKLTAEAKTRAFEAFTNQDVFFGINDASLSDDVIKILTDKIDWLKDNPEVSVAIEVHCDERGTKEYNSKLAERRAESIKNYMGEAGIDFSRFKIIIFGEDNPIDADHNEKAWTKNRRAHFQIQQLKTADIKQPETKKITDPL